MKKWIFGMVSLMAVPVLANSYSLKCVRDNRAFDGGLVQFELKTDASGASTLTYQFDTQNPAVSRKLDATVRGLHCSFPSADHREVSCAGRIPFITKKADDRFLGPSLQASLSLEKLTPSFKLEPLVAGASRNGCTLTE